MLGVGVGTPQQERMPLLEQAEEDLRTLGVVAGSYYTQSEGHDLASLVVSLVYSGKRWQRDQTMVSHYL